MTKYWLVYQHGNPVEFLGLFRRHADAQATYQTERENLRAAGGEYESVAIEEFVIPSYKQWST